MTNPKTENAFFEGLLSHSESVDIKKLLMVFLSRWYWIVGCLILSSVICFVYLKFAIPQYIASVTVKYQERQSELDELTHAKPTYVFSAGNTDYLTEKFNVKSQEVVENALSKLDNSFTFYRLKDLRKFDIYPTLPLTLEVLSFDPEQYTAGTFTILNDLKLNFSSGENDTPLPMEKGAVVKVPGLSFRIDSVNIEPGLEFEFVYNDISEQAEDFISRIDMNEVEETMPVLNMSFQHHNKAYTKDFLAKLVEAYQEFDLKQKQQSSDLTLRFINDQLGIYSDSLKVAARDLEIFKQQNQVLDISSSASEITSQLRELEQDKQKLEIQKAYITLLEDNLGKTFEPINYLSVGLDATTDGILVGLLERFNTLVSKRKDLLLKYSPNALAIKNLDEELEKYRAQILDNISLQKQKIRGVDQIMSASIASFRRRFNQIPGLEKNFLYLQSAFEVNKNIYSLLLNKEIESSIVRAGMLPSFVVITRPDIHKISPKPLQVAILSIFFGLCLGVGSVLFARLNNEKFTNIEGIESHPETRLLGVLYHFPDRLTNSASDKALFLANRSIFTESVSSIRTKLSFTKSNLGANSEKTGKQLLVTSEKSGEGKSFVSLNLALSLNKIGKKVIIVASDLRKSKLHQYFDDENRTGLSDYLAGRETDTSKIIKKTSIPGLDYVPSGTPPFDPGELLQRPIFEDFLELCRKNYDFVLVDTAPIGLVADSIPLLHQSDHVIFIIRWLYSEKEAYSLAAQMAKDYSIPAVDIIINDYFPDALHTGITSGSGYNQGKGRYRYDYSYRDNGYYTQKSKSGFKKFFQKK